MFRITFALVLLMFQNPVFASQTSNHLNGNRFVNPEPIPQKSLWTFLKWRLTRKSGEWPEKMLPAVKTAKPPLTVLGDKLRVTFVNHSTVLIQVNGYNILTDPIWSDRCSPVSWAGPKRAQEPGLLFDDLPQIDLVLISHNHYDHLDIPTLTKLTSRKKPVVLTGLGNAKLVSNEQLSEVKELDWWQEVSLSSGVKVTFVPAKHFSGRGLFDRNKTLWGGFVVETGGYTIYFAGDTGYGSHFKEISERFPNIFFAILPIGAYEPRWFMSPVHLDPTESTRAFLDLKAEHGIAVHFGTFQLADDSFNQPAEDTRKALLAVSDRLEARFWIPRFGEHREFSFAGKPGPSD